MCAQLHLAKAERGSGLDVPHSHTRSNLASASISLRTYVFLLSKSFNMYAERLNIGPIHF